jgi:hypothetical protein
MTLERAFSVLFGLILQYLHTVDFIICVTNYMHLMYYHIHILNTRVKMLVTYNRYYN